MCENFVVESDVIFASKNSFKYIETLFSKNHILISEMFYFGLVFVLYF